MFLHYCTLPSNFIPAPPRLVKHVGQCGQDGLEVGAGRYELQRHKVLHCKVGKGVWGWAKLHQTRTNVRGWQGMQSGLLKHR